MHAGWPPAQAAPYYNTPYAQPYYDPHQQYAAAAAAAHTAHSSQNHNSSSKEAESEEGLSVEERNSAYVAAHSGAFLMTHFAFPDVAAESSS